MPETKTSHLSTFSPKDRSVALQKELISRIQPIDYGYMLADVRALLLGVGQIFRNTVLTDHLASQAEVFKNAGITHYVPGTPRNLMGQSFVDQSMKEAGIITNNPTYAIYDILDQVPGSKIAILLDAYLVLREEVPIFMNSQSLGIQLNTPPYRATSVMFTGGSKGAPKELLTGARESGIDNREFMVDTRNLRGQEENPAYLKGLDFIIHLPKLNDDAK